MEQVHEHDSGDDDDDDDIDPSMKSACIYVCCLLDTLIAPPLVDDMLAHTKIVQDLEQFREFEIETDDRVNIRQELELATDKRESTVCMNFREVEVEAGQANKTGDSVQYFLDVGAT